MRVIFEPEARIVSQIFQWVAVESAGVLTVAKRLNAEGVPSPWASKGEGNGSWNSTCIRGILRNPNYKGETVQWRYHKIKRRTSLRHESEFVRLPEGITPAITSPEVWARAQERLATNRGEAKRNESHPYLLRGHILCAKCGARMSSDA